MVAVTVFLAATLLFIGLFNQTIQTAVIYQRHQATATKASDLLDSMLLSPGVPVNWGQLNDTPTAFGLQNPEFTQYELSPFSLMRLNYANNPSAYYQKANNNTGMYYSNITIGSGNFLFMPLAEAINYSMAQKLLGINNTYGFQLTLSPLVTVSVSEERTNPLRLSINAAGIGFPLANAPVSCRLIPILLNGTSPSYLNLPDQTRTVYTDQQGSASVDFNVIVDDNLVYAFVAYAHLGGLCGVGYYEHNSDQSQYIIPFVDSLSAGTILLAHSSDIPNTDAPPGKTLHYNAIFVFANDNFDLQTALLDDSTGNVTSSAGYDIGHLTIPNFNPGIVVIAYRNDLGKGGVVMMPWGLSSLGFQMVFGGDPSKQEWVATDMRQVTINGIAYQAKLALWSYEGYQVIG
jgi:hypothetical protein